MQESKALPREASAVSAVSMASDTRTEAHALVASSPKQGKQVSACQVEPSREACETHLCSAQHLSLLQASVASVSTEVWRVHHIPVSLAWLVC